MADQINFQSLNKEFGDSVTADHAILNEMDESRSHDRVACIIQDRYTGFCMGYPARSKNAMETRVAMQRFFGAHGLINNCKHVYTDNSKEFKAAMKSLCIIHDLSLIHI